LRASDGDWAAKRNGEEAGVIHWIFQVCVQILYVAGQWLGIGYEAINVWVFVVVWPLFTLGLVVVVVWQWRALRRLKNGGTQQ
jgi:hypothetical protein